MSRILIYTCMNFTYLNISFLLQDIIFILYEIVEFYLKF